MIRGTSTLAGMFVHLVNSKGFERNIHGELKREIKAKGFPYLTQMNFWEGCKRDGSNSRRLGGEML